MELIAPTAFGLESVTARELMNLGYTDQQTENGKVTFSGDEYAVARTNMWLRTAGRVLIKIGEFKALSFEELFQGTKALPWEDWLPVNAEFPVSGKSVQSGLFSVPDCQAIVKKAIVERMKQRYKREIFEENGPLYRIEVALLKDTVTLTLDTTGAGLHKRGYRKVVGEAPIKETMAAALILLSYWKHDRILCDPLCGTGTIPIEAAMIALNRAPGLLRSFDSEKWPNIKPDIWVKAKEEANSLLIHDKQLYISGSDIDAKAVDLAKQCAHAAGVGKYIDFQIKDVKKFNSQDKYGFIITNPPYGERLGEKREIEQLYKDMSVVYKKLDTWSCYIISAHPEFEKLFGRKADKRRKLFSGRIMCQYYQFYGPKPPYTPKI